MTDSNTPAAVAAKTPAAAISLRSVLTVGAVAAAPVFAVLMMIGWLRPALSLAGGSFASLATVIIVRVIVDTTVSSARRNGRNAGSAEMASFGIATLVKFVAITAIVFALNALHANLIWVLIGFTITQVAVAIYTARASMRSAA